MSLTLIIILITATFTTVLLTLWLDWQTKLLGMFVLLGSFIYLAAKTEYYRRRFSALQRLQDAYNQLDQQTKLIIRTDLELHRTQEELDRRLASLLSLHQLGRQLRVSLRPEEVFGKLDASTVTNFGFSKALLGMCPSLNTIEWCSLIGVSAQEAETISTHLLENRLLKQVLTTPGPLFLDIQSTNDPFQKRLLHLLDVSKVVVTGIIPHAGPSGCLVLGRTHRGILNIKADEELIAILTNQLAVAVENSALYEQTWAVQRQLEQKIQDRTQELEAANTALVQLNKAKSDFVSSVSHELRTPLAAIKGYASLLNSGQFGAMAKNQQERLAKIEKHADLLTQMINNLLDIARIESGRVTMQKETIPLAEFLATVHEAVQPQIEAKHLRYQLDLDGIHRIVGDAQQLQRVFVNLLSNAIKYTPESGIIRMTWQWQEPGKLLQIAISDSGCGIAREDIPKLFQEFYRVNDAINQEVKGTGLGLALVKQIIEAHGGKIGVESQMGKGTTVTLCLPMEESVRN